MTYDQGQQIIQLLTDMSTRMDALGMILAQCEIWLGALFVFMVLMFIVAVSRRST